MTARRPASGERRSRTFAQTPAQTIGPFFAPALLGRGREAGNGEVLVPVRAKGIRVRIEGRVLDGAGEPVSDAMLEVWQANADGRYDHPADTRGDAGLDDAFHGFARLGTDAGGGFRLETVKPGPVPGRGNAWQAPHLNLLVFARGLLHHLCTRVVLRRRGRGECCGPRPPRRRARAAGHPRGDSRRGAPEPAPPRLPLRHPPPGGRRDGVPRLLSRSGSPAATRPRVRCGAWPPRRGPAAPAVRRPAPAAGIRPAPCGPLSAARARPRAGGLW